MSSQNLQVHFCGLFPESFLTWSNLKPNLNGMFACDLCDKEYKYKRNLYSHKKDECGQEPRFQCPQCSYRTKRKGNLKSHLAIRHECYLDDSANC
ncbi:longitudinals lacking protein, isoforms A/B/D/L-like [Diaphorina citri]|uniref:Longitudinals lacking protein, isoforms A/B/D/L-like n=1 Tax=Diaphorina citri TaxID=121845 RepID=A0A3Q0JDQ7_DIACI|nr:longitudinals lacking protein, isoforms A/B/D/L-like [Diaphorina citri]